MVNTLPDLSAPGLADLAPRMPFWKGMVIGVQGQPCDSLYIIARGQVLLSRRNQSGEDYALYLLGPGDLFGEGSLRPGRSWLVTTRAVTDGQALVLPSPQLPRLAQYYPQLTAHVVALLSARLERAHIRLDVITTDSARARVLRLLRVLAGYHGEMRGGGIWISLGVTQAELGEMIGLTRESVARALSDLEADGIIRRRRRRGIWLLSDGTGEPAAGQPYPGGVGGA